MGHKTIDQRLTTLEGIVRDLRIAFDSNKEKQTTKDQPEKQAKPPVKKAVKKVAKKAVKKD